MERSVLINFYCLSESKADETLKNANLCKLMEQFKIEFSKVSSSMPTKKQANALYIAASKIKPAIEGKIPFIAQCIEDGRLDSELRVSLATKYLLEHLTDEEVNIPGFEEACGIGVHVSEEDIENAVKLIILENESFILEKRYNFNLGIIMTKCKNLPKMQWADGSKLKREIEQQVRILLGPKTEEELLPKSKRNTSHTTGNQQIKKEKKGVLDDNQNQESKTIVSVTEKMLETFRKLPFHKPGCNYITEGYPSSEGVLKLLKQHVALTNGQVRTRFPPEPNGILHIGHAKAININFGYAKAHNGICHLRYDDTNPEREEEHFFKSILDMVKWLGYVPDKITHASDYFDQLYEFANVLIKKNLAYVCHQNTNELKGWEAAPESPWRNRSIEDNLMYFKAMKDGMFEEGHATLRMKITLEEGKQDPVAYRIRYRNHPRTGDKWCIYPTYDFTHCLCDSLENITHSMCTKEFQSRRSSYYWLCESVDTYVPVQWEYGRLNMHYTVVSKRKIAKLIKDGFVLDWDDPRLFTLPALRRRGFPPEAINDFCLRIGVTGATIAVGPTLLEACVRDHLNVIAPRTMVVSNPIQVILNNLPSTKKGLLDVPDFPAVKSTSYHSVTLDDVIYIEAEDFRENSSGSYKRFAKDQTVGLRHTGLVLKFKDEVKKHGETFQLIADCEEITSANKPKGFIHWVSDPVKVDIQIFDRLFNHKNPEDVNEVPDGFLSDCNPKSFSIVKAYADKYIVPLCNPCTQFQFERKGYYSVDYTSSENLLIFNRTVSLREDNEKD